APRLAPSSTTSIRGWRSRTAAAVPSTEPLSTTITFTSWRRSERPKSPPRPAPQAPPAEPLSTTITFTSWRGSERSKSSRRSRVATTIVTRSSPTTAVYPIAGGTYSSPGAREQHRLCPHRPPRPRRLPAGRPALRHHSGPEWEPHHGVGEHRDGNERSRNRACDNRTH